MGKRGPAPTPTALRLLKGDDKTRINRQEPKPAEVPLKPPAYLDDDARAVWDRLAVDHFAKVGVSHWDADALAVYCSAVVVHRRAVAAVNRDGVLIRTRSRGHDEAVKHPALQVIRDQAAIIRAFAQEFGLTPSARSSLVRPEAGASSNADRLLS